MKEPKIVKYITLDVSKTRFVVGRVMAGHLDSYVPVCECKSRPNALKIMEALAQMEERKNG